ncbi:YHYH protein [Undibacterium cyanobacteriorum]|uniref:YHYH protein n=1 Tax=Undibacterium cyanobacteriorum TaxID=3073561 RepID=A0ABY9RFY2_9BURK|nr:YHYH protein [Undibacterium sp. 20NA77.5]WMW79137.1 YHYH protein [Undibacterium sp. 20NA77.5]
MSAFLTLRQLVYLASALLLSACGGTAEDQPARNTSAQAVTMSGPPATLIGARNNYVISVAGSTASITDITGQEAQRTASMSDKLVFKDVSVDLSLSTVLPKINETQLRSLIELYIAFFNRVPDAEGMHYWIQQIIDGRTVLQIADSFYSAGKLYPDLTGYSDKMSNADFVTILYKNVLGRSGSSAPSAAEVNYWVNDIESGRQSRSTVVIAMLYSARVLADDPVVGWVTRLLNNKISVGRYLAIEQGLSFLNDADNITKSIAIAALIDANDTDQALAGLATADQQFTLSKTVPSAPKSLAATVGNASISLQFSAPSRNGGSAITSYTATCIGNGKTSQQTAQSSPISLTGLLNGTSYSCTVRATNAQGDSDASNSVNATPSAPTSSFKLISSAGLDGAAMAADYTCDGTGSSIPLSWSNAPSGTKEFALLMTTIPGDGTTKWNWVLYNIPAATSSLVKDSIGVGTLGVGSDGPLAAYQAPCSQGPGAKVYTLTLYALSAAPTLPSSGAITGAILKDAIANITLGSASTNLSFTRTTMTGSSNACQMIRNSLTASNTGYVSVSCDANYAYVSSLGIANHTMMNGITATNLQVPTVQKFNGAYGWKIPLSPAIAASTTSAVDGPIGVAINGVPIFNPCKQGGCQNGDTKVLGELDICNGHAGRSDDYHYHAAPTCVMAAKPSSYWDTHPVGWALDGFAIYGYNNADGKVAPRDSVCGGNTDPNTNGPSGYAYHVTDASPYVLSCFRGTPSPDLANQSSKYSPMRQPPVTPFSVSNMTLSTDPSDGYQVLQFTSAKTFVTNEVGSDSYTNTAGTYKIRYKALSGTDLASALATPKNAGKSMCWAFQFQTSGGTTTQPNITYCR